MSTIDTLGRILRRKQSLTLMTSPSHTLSNRSPNQILSTTSRRNRKFRLLSRPRQFNRPSTPRLLLLQQRPDSTLLWLGGLALRRRVAGTFLAAGVLAVDTDFVGAEGGLAAVTGAADAHADRLGDSLDGHVARGFPFAGFEGKAVFGEESLGFGLLDGAPVGNHGRFLDLGGEFSGVGVWLDWAGIVSSTSGQRTGKDIRFSIVKGSLDSLGRSASTSLAGDILRAGDRGLGGTFLQNGPHTFDILGQALRLVLIFLSRHFAFRSLSNILQLLRFL